MMQSNQQSKFNALKIIASFLLLTMTYQNCSQYNSQVSTSPINQSQLDVLEGQSLGILASRCLQCHNANNKQGGVNVADVNEMIGNGVVNVEEPDLSFLLRSVKAGTMPPSRPLAQAEIVILNDWIYALKASPPSVTPPPVNQPLTATFSSIQRNILQPKCLGCHGAAGGFSYADYPSTMRSVVAGNPTTSKFYQSILNNQMPKNNQALTAAEKMAVLDWINQGAQNN
jgi:mono/diheme cytochrome c family protein